MASDDLVGRYFDGRSTRPSAVRITVDGDGLGIENEASEYPRRWSLKDVSISERLGQSQRRIQLPDGGFIEVADNPDWDVLPQQWGRSGMRLAWLEERWRYVLASLVGVVIACVAFYVYGLPWMAEKVAARIPAKWVQQLSTGTLDVIDRIYTEPSKLSPARQKEITDAFAGWSPPFGDVPPYRLHFRDGTHMGPNAFALPSGDIVITDQLIELAKDDREILGVLAHELGHEHRRHALRQLLQSAIVAVAANVFLGDMGDMTGAAAALLSLRYSRDFEREADDYAARMMRHNHVDPRRLADMLERLDPEGAKDGKKSSGASGYFGTHPITAERIERLEDQALAGTAAP